MKVKEIPRKIAYGTAKQAASWVAPLVALSSIAGKGGDGYLDNVIASFEVPKQILKVGYAVTINKGSRDVFLLALRT